MNYLLWQPIPSYRTLYSPKGLKVEIFAIEIILSSLLGGPDSLILSLLLGGPDSLILSSLLGGPDSPSRGYRQLFLLSYWNTWNTASVFYFDI